MVDSGSGAVLTSLDSLAPSGPHVASLLEQATGVERSQGMSLETIRGECFIEASGMCLNMKMNELQN